MGQGCRSTLGLPADCRLHHATCHPHAAESPCTVVLVFVPSPFEVALASASAMCFGKGGGIIDHAQEQQRSAVHDLFPLFRYGLYKSAVKHLPFRAGHPCRKVTELIHHILQHRVLEQTVHFGMDITGVFVGFFLEMFRPLLNGIHVLFEVGQLSVSQLQLILFVCQFELDIGKLLFQLVRLGGYGIGIALVLFQFVFKNSEPCLFLRLLLQKIFHHRGQTLNPALCQPDVRLEIRKDFLVSGYLFLNGRTFLRQHTTVFFGCSVASTGF